MQKFTQMPDEVKAAYNKYCRGRGTIIAGGAVRDALNEKRIKDIDIFVHKDKAELYDVIIEEFSLMGRPGSKLFGYDSPPTQNSTASQTYTFGSLRGIVKIPVSAELNSSGYQNNTKIVEVFEGYDFGYELNLIFLEVDPEEYVTQHFDFGICKAWYDGTYIHMHGDYRNDINNKTITMTLPQERVIELYGSVAKGVTQMEEHAYRISEKYRNFQVIMPKV